MTITINGSGTVTGANTLTNTNTVTSAAATALTLQSAGTTAVTIDTNQNVGIGESTPSSKLTVAGTGSDHPLQVRNTGTASSDDSIILVQTSSTGATSTISGLYFGDGDSNSIGRLNYNHVDNSMAFFTNSGERMRISSSGGLLVGTTSGSFSAKGTTIFDNGQGNYVADAANVQFINRLTNDGSLVSFSQAGTEEGNISVSGTTVSYNGGHLSRWAQTTTAKDDTLVKGTVLSNLDEMNVYTDADGNPVENEQLNKVKVSNVEGDVNVAGVFVNWSHDDAHDVDEINMAMTGDMIIRIAQGTAVARGDLLMAAGDGTAKPQGDDIVRSKTVAKVTSTHVTCTYADGSFCVPCVLMAC